MSSRIILVNYPQKSASAYLLLVGLLLQVVKMASGRASSVWNWPIFKPPLPSNLNVINWIEMRGTRRMV